MITESNRAAQRHFFDITSDKRNFYLIIILLVTLEAAALSNGKPAFSKTFHFPSYLVQTVIANETLLPNCRSQ